MRLLLYILLMLTLPAGSITLQEAIESAIQNNLKSIESEIELKKVEHRIREIRAGLFPKLSFRAEFTRWDESYISSFVPTNRLFMTLTLSQVIFDRSVFLALRLAKDSRELRKLILEDVRREVVKETQKLFYLALFRKEILGEYETSLKYWKSFFKYVEAKYREGIVPKHELLRAKAQLQMAKANLKRAKAEYEKALSSLSTLIGKENIRDVEGSLSENFPRTEDISIEKNSTLRVLKKSIELQELNRELVNAESYPKVRLFGAYQGNNLKDFENGRLKDDFRHGYSLRLQADWTIFDWGQKKERLSQENLELEKLRERYRSKKVELSNTLKSILSEIEALKLELEARHLSLRASEEALKLSTERYREGIAPQLEVLEAATNHERSRIELLRSLYTLSILRAELSRLIE